MIAALEISIDVDLRLFSQYLRQLGIEHRINEQAGNQIIWLADEARKQQVVSLYQRFESGELQLAAEEAPGQPRGSLLQGVARAVKHFPVTLSLMLISIVCFPITFGIETGEEGSLLRYMTFVDYNVGRSHVFYSSIEETLGNMEIWRLWTPMLLHFGIVHIVFNLLWFWEIGRRIEWIRGGTTLVNLTLVTSLAANLSQYWMSGPTLFGGMSGVVYGFLGYSLIWSRLVPEKSTGVASGVYIFMLLFLLIGFTGMIDLLGFGAIANGAHLGGLMALRRGG